MGGSITTEHMLHDMFCTAYTVQNIEVFKWALDKLVYVNDITTYAFDIPIQDH